MNEIQEKYNSLCNSPSDINEHLPIMHKYAKECESIIECGVRDCVSSWSLVYGLLNNNKRVMEYVIMVKLIQYYLSGT